MELRSNLYKDCRFLVEELFPLKIEKPNRKTWHKGIVYRRLLLDDWHRADQLVPHANGHTFLKKEYTSHHKNVDFRIRVLPMQNNLF